MTHETVAQLKLQIRSDLAEAMRDRRIADVSALRCILAAIDDAEAIEVGKLHDKYQVARFGDRSVEVPRKTLSREDLQQLIQLEIAARIEASVRCKAAGRHPEATSLLRETDVLKAYLD